MPYTNMDRFHILQNVDDVNLRYALQKGQMLDNLAAVREREQLIEEIAERVIARLVVSADVSQAIFRIDELKRAINSLGGREV